ncbi:MAG TPA: LytTR family transcriptional regulator DNA-binding domain-containing protein [Bacillota bacterium]|nr:LytTR family transcriptional regulator DNA-binding domain-containing protein [Bacillota bacterium]
MNVLSIENIEKHSRDTVLFPSVSLSMSTHEILAIHCSLNVRNVLLGIFIGENCLSSGDVFLNGENISSLTNNHKHITQQVGICFFNDGLYERLTVIDHLTFYKGLFHSDQTIDQVLHDIQLATKKHLPVKKLTFSEQKRIQFARLLLQNPSLFIFEEPDLNIDLETKQIFLQIVKRLQQDDKSILVLTSNLESAITVANRVYRLDEKGLHVVPIDGENHQRDHQAKDFEQVKRQALEFQKIPTKTNDKMVLFDPPEIDYIDSKEGQVYLYIKGEAFPTTFTLQELEERLIYYGFFRCHRSYIVNLQKVREVITWTRNSFNLILDDDPKSSIPLSKAKMSQLKEMLGLK